MAQPAVSSPVIVATALTKRYGDVTAVDGIDFEVQRGECFGLLGPNGAGKTTTMKMIYRACSIGDGHLRVFEHDVGDGRNDRAIKRRLGVVPQVDDLDLNLTVRETLEAFARFHRTNRASELLVSFGLAAKADVPIGQLSGGFRRRLQLARSLLGTPEILILDEPTTGLDPQIRLELWQRLRELRHGGTTLLLTTHYLEEAERLCDRLVIVDRGRIVAAGAPASLIAEHLPSHVLETRASSDVVAAVEDARDPADRVEHAGDRIFVYTNEGDRLLARLHGLSAHGALLRRTTLEDVFLKLTGRSLSE